MRFRLRTLLIVLAIAFTVFQVLWVAIAGFDAIRRDAIENPPIKGL